MAFVTGFLLIDAPASALNNLGQIPGGVEENAVGAKFISTREGFYPYVSAQAFRYWLRTTLERGPWGWKAAPVYREEKVAYTDANPIRWWDDDLFGYMRSPGTSTQAKKKRQEAPEYQRLTPLETKNGEERTVTRVSPFRLSTLVAIAPVSLTIDFGVMARQEGDPVPHEHQFYRTTLQGLFSLDLHAVGTFTYRSKTGYLNLDAVRVEEAEKAGLERLEEEKAFRLPLTERLARVAALFEGLAHLEGGAKQTLHYTDVSPDLVITAVTRGGNHVFGHVVGPDNQGRPRIKVEALREALTVFGKEILSKVYVGWVRGYMDEQRRAFEASLDDSNGLGPWKERIVIQHSREALVNLVEDLKRHPEWLA